MDMARDHRKNSEGYMDLTAYEAIRRADRDLEIRKYDEIHKKTKKINKKKHKKNKNKKNIKKMEEKQKCTQMTIKI